MQLHLRYSNVEVFYIQYKSFDSFECLKAIVQQMLSPALVNSSARLVHLFTLTRMHKVTLSDTYRTCDPDHKHQLKAQDCGPPTHKNKQAAIASSCFLTERDSLAVNRSPAGVYV